MQIMKQFSIFLVNKPGVLAGVTSALAKAKVNIIALSLMDSGEHGTLRIVCTEGEKAREVLGSAHDRWTESDVLVMTLSNQPGEFAHVAEKLSREHVNITYAYCTGGAADGKTSAVFKLADLKKAQQILKDMDKPAKKATVTKPRTIKNPKGRK
jgi:hypothetical protein